MPCSHNAGEVCTLAPTSPIPGAWAVTLDHHFENVGQPSNDHESRISIIRITFRAWQCTSNHNPSWQNLWFASLSGLGRRPSPGLLQCIKTMQMVGPRRHVFAIALTARASDERQTRNDNPHVLLADLRSR